MPMIEPHSNLYRRRSVIMLNNFLGGISWGVGSVIGATLVVSLLAFLLARSTELPWIGQILESVMQEIEEQSILESN